MQRPQRRAYRSARVRRSFDQRKASTGWERAGRPRPLPLENRRIQGKRPAGGAVGGSSLGADDGVAELAGGAFEHGQSAECEPADSPGETSARADPAGVAAIPGAVCQEFNLTPIFPHDTFARSANLNL